MHDKERTIGCHLLRWVGCSRSSNHSKFFVEHNGEDYGRLRDMVHGEGESTKEVCFHSSAGSNQETL